MFDPSDRNRKLDTSESVGGRSNRDIIAERVKGGLRRAKEKGRELGRPKVEVKFEGIRRLREAGLSFAEIAARVSYTDRNGRKRHISKTQAHRILNEGNRVDYK